ncbi:MAG: phenylalanine--tRNA ligase subunit beta [Pseudomonadota bacterium]|nr:phenylalanine--tRNA ligase subunit beta [Pseudomonadota bacterium]
MKFTLSWLKDHLDTTASLDEIAATLTAIGLEVESVADRARALKDFTVAKILSAEKHPQADKLQVCRVESDAGELQIVCGAPNARAGLRVALAKEGAVIPHGGMVIKKTKIRGVESNGMLCSAAELGLGAGGDGIIELPETAKTGQSVVDVLGLNDPVIDIAVTPNRADCLGVRGIARDLAAAGLGKLKEASGAGCPAPDKKNASDTRRPSPVTFPSPISITIATSHCPQFIGCFIKGVKNGASPEWLRKRLEAIGQKSISALVDITNYVTIDLGRPLHVFDAAKLRGGITVRAAREGEKLKALNGREYILREGMTVVADEGGALSLGGIIGGESTGCGEATTDVFLEVALFDPAHIARTGRTLDILSDARYRFERGVDPAFVEDGARIATRMIQELCGGEASQLARAGKTPEWKRRISFHPKRVETLGGVAINAGECDRILAALGFEKSGANIIPPSWRGDVEGEADAVEEVLRIYGYDHIPPAPLPGASRQASSATPAQTARKRLASRGMLECCNWSFISATQAKLFGGNNPALKLLNPISADLDAMRPSLLPGLLEAAKRNTHRGYSDNALFEAGIQFHDVTPDGQRMMAAGVRAGNCTERQYKDGLFHNHERAVDAFDAKTDALAVLQALGAPKCSITADPPPWYHPGRSGALTLGKTVLGYFGEVHPGLLATFDLEKAAAFEIFLDAIPAPRAGGRAKPPIKLSNFPAVGRDFAFTVDEKIPAAEMVAALAKADQTLITGVSIFDVYTGKGIEPGKKSVAVKVTLQSFDRTLSEQEIAAVSQAVVGAAQKGFGGRLRQ